MTNNKRTKKILKWVLGIVAVPVLFFIAAISIVYFNQDKIVQTLLSEVNAGFPGTLSVKNSHISPFHNFPYISVDMEDITFHEDKDVSREPILEISDAYVGFDLWSIISGKFQVRLVELKTGQLHLLQYADGNMNIINAFSTLDDQDTTSTKEELHLDLKKFRLLDVMVTKRNETDKKHVECFVHHAEASFKTSPEHLYTSLNGKFELDVVDGQDTLRFFRHKHIDLDVRADFDKLKEVLVISPSELKLEGISFSAEGKADLKDDVNLDLKLGGSKSDFNLLFAFLPEDLAQYMQRYKNAGNLYFEATIKGKAINGNTPAIDARFGCKNGYFENKTKNRHLDELAFNGYYTNGKERNSSTSEVGLLDVFAKPEQGIVQGNLVMRNFADPRVDLRVFTDFDLKFLAEFLELEELKDLSGKVTLNVNFDELIDIQFPESSLIGLQKGTDSKLTIQNLHFRHPSYPLPVQNLNLVATMKDGNVVLEQLGLKVGKSDIALDGHIDNIPAILHQGNEEIGADLHIRSNRLFLKELTSFDTLKFKPLNEDLSNLDARFSFKAMAKEIAAGKPLPKGEFFIDDLYVTLKNYPHKLHDFHADIIIGEKELEVKDFSGEIDKTDLHFSGKIADYHMWFLPEPKGDAKISFDIVSHQLVLHDLLSYNGENYLPEEYRNESVKELKIHGLANFHYNNGFEWFDVHLDKLEGKLNVHPLKLEKFSGNIHYQDHRMTTKNLAGNIGRSDFRADVSYYLKTDSSRKGKDNYVIFKSSNLDFDELTNFTPTPSNTKKVDHDSVFSVFELPFYNTRVDVNIGGMNYHKIKLKNITTRIRLQENHYLYIDTLSMDMADGHVDMSGYFNGSDPKQIYFSPNLRFRNLDIEQLLFKIDNLGEDELLGNTIHGALNGKLTGKLHMHTDLVPIIRDSEIHLDVSIVNGQLVKFKPMEALASFFKDKNLSLVRFDTLKNKFDMKDGVINIPSMTINSSLGFIEVSGKQTLDAEMEFYVRIPWQLVTDVGAKLLFGGKRREEVDPDQVDAIVYRDADKKVRFVNVKITGTSDNLKISLGKEKKQSEKATSSADKKAENNQE